MSDAFTTHEQVLGSVWSGLHEGAAQAIHPFHTPVLATVSASGPDVRTVVLRDVDEMERRIFCHTDARSPKVSMLAHNPDIAWLFYDRDAKVQLRLYGKAELHRNDAVAKTRWEQSTPRSRQCYLTDHAPGTLLPAEAGYHAQEADGFENFAVISTEIFAIDWLFLRAKGHQRVRFDFYEDRWNAEWIAP